MKHKHQHSEAQSTPVGLDQLSAFQSLSMSAHVGQGLGAGSTLSRHWQLARLGASLASRMKHVVHDKQHGHVLSGAVAVDATDTILEELEMAALRQAETESHSQT